MREGHEIQYPNVVFVCPENSYLKTIEYHCNQLENHDAIFIRAFECSDGTRSNLIQSSRWDEYSNDIYSTLEIERGTQVLFLLVGKKILSPAPLRSKKIIFCQDLKRIMLLFSQHQCRNHYKRV
jgi:hypothetical protein